jgi:HEAT repeat protein
VNINRIPFITIVIFVIFSQGCGSEPTPAPISELSNADLIKLLEDYANPDYNITTYPRYAIVDELEKRGPSASEAAPALAKSMAYNERGSYQASDALIAMGPSAESAIPYLLQNLENDREVVRRHSLFVLGILGELASCAVPNIAALLWDEESFVRSTAAGALTEITDNELVEYEDLRLDPSLPGSVSADDPEGRITGMAREWWLETGQKMNWPKENCKVPK